MSSALKAAEYHLERATTPGTKEYWQKIVNHLKNKGTKK